MHNSQVTVIFTEQLAVYVQLFAGPNQSLSKLAFGGMHRILVVQNSALLKQTRPLILRKRLILAVRSLRSDQKRDSGEYNSHQVVATHGGVSMNDKVIIAPSQCTHPSNRDEDICFCC